MHKMIRSSSLFALLALAAMLAAPGCGSDEGQRLQESAQIDVDPPAGVVFSSAILAEGELAPTEQVIITNVGKGELIVQEISLVESDSTKEFSLLYEIPRDLNGDKLYNMPDRLVCPNRDNFRLVSEDQETDDSLSYCVLWIRYEPKDTRADNGTLTIRSNDTTRGPVSLDVSSGESNPELTVSPEPVHFEEIFEGDVATEELILFNSGKADLVIESWEMVNDAEGQFSVEVSPDKGTYHVAGSTLRPAASVDDRETIVLLVHYSPSRIGGAEGKLRISSNDPNNRQKDITVEARSIRPCIELDPEDADFGDVAIGEAKELPIDLYNCGNADLVITEASFVDPGTSEDFIIYTAPGGLECAGERSCTGEIVIPEGGTETLVLQYTPDVEGPDGGKLLLKTNVAGKEEFEVSLFGNGTTNTCPVAVAEARIAGADTWDEFPDEDQRLETIPLKTLELRGENSTDPDGSIAAYQWTVLERPEDSTAQLQDHEAVPNPTFFLDLAGRYVFELQVTDNKGLPSCRNALVVIEAVPDEDIHIQLVWDTPADPDQTDEGFAAGSDLDVHLLHPLGDWFDLPHDCFYGNPNPDWGRPANGSDDPSLDRDDTDGAGPENINLDNPEANRVYRVGAHYFNDHGYGASFVTIRIFVEGILRFEMPNKRMAATDYFWDVATISWPGGNIQPIDSLMASAPNGGGQ